MKALWFLREQQEPCDAKLSLFVLMLRPTEN